MKNKILILFAILLFNHSWGQIPYLSKEAKVSVLSCGPGSELYSKFGHSAIRIKDPVNRMDIVYNYGVFDFNQPNFYLNFGKGRLNYMLVRHRTADFINQYKSEKRGIVEQVLNLNTSEQNKLLNFLENNAKPENRTYSYHFFFNNCATKLIDVIAIANPDIVFEKEFIDENLSFRSLINNKISENNWGAFGINTALGSKIDQTATDYQHRFLPENIKLQLDHSSIDHKPLVSESNQLLEQTLDKGNNLSILSPLVLFSVVLFLTIFLVFKSNRYHYWQLFVFSLCGLIGIGILFLWFFTDHDMTQNNFNILWANPLLLLLAFTKNLKASIKNIILLISILGLALIPIIEIIQIQSFNYTIFPLLTALLILLVKNYKTIKRA